MEEKEYPFSLYVAIFSVIFLVVVLAAERGLLQ